MAIPNPSPNIADGVKSDVTTYSSNKIESLISTATELPIPEAGDAGKVLTVNGDADGYELDTPVDPTSIIDDSAADDDTVFSSSKIAELFGGFTTGSTTIQNPTVAGTTATGKYMTISYIKVTKSFNDNDYFFEIAQIIDTDDATLWNKGISKNNTLIRVYGQDADTGYQYLTNFT